MPDIVSKKRTVCCCMFFVYSSHFYYSDENMKETGFGIEQTGAMLRTVIKKSTLAFFFVHSDL